jgi:hypothetical protein
LLPNPALKPWYDRVVWLFVSRNFKDDARDREALRTHERFGISSWPQMIVFDPIDDSVLLDPPRDLAGFVRAFERAVARTAGRAPNAGITATHRALRDPPAEDDRPALVRLDDANSIVRAVALEELAAKDPIPEAALQEAAAILARPGEDVVVYVRALRLCKKVRPQAVLSRADEILAIANDPVRYEVLDLLAANPDESLAPILNRMFAHAGREVPSRNPNVLRMRTAPCLGHSGDAASVDVLAPLARAADWRNGTTKVVLQALAKIGSRLPAARESIVDVLLESFPPAVGEDDARATRASLGLAAAVAEALAAVLPRWRAPKVPQTWDADARAAFVAAASRG